MEVRMRLEQLIKKCGTRLQSLGREGDWWTATAVPDVSHPFISTIAETPQKALQLLLDNLEEEDRTTFRNVAPGRAAQACHQRGRT
jgi:hypothetical protein